MRNARKVVYLRTNQLWLYKMGKTLDTMIVKDPSPRIRAMLEKMREYKVAQLEKMRNMSSYDYEIKVR